MTNSVKCAIECLIALLHTEVMLKYRPIRVSTLRGDMKIPFNAYVRVAGKYILLCREGDSFENDRLERLKGKKLQRMFIAETQEAAYNDYLRENIKIAYEDTKHKPLEIRAQVVQGSLQAMTEDLFEDPESQAFYKVANEGALKFKKFFLSEPGSLASMLAIKNVDFSVAHHGVVVTALSLAIAESMGFFQSRPMQMEPLSVGAMIHDLEHNHNNINFSVAPEKLTPGEKAIYNRHSIDGAKRIQDVHFYDKMIVQIVAHHEEKMDGSGPQGLREKDIDPLVFTVATANVFDHLLTYENLSPKDALKKMLIEKMGILPLDIMRALQDALKKRGII